MIIQLQTHVYTEIISGDIHYPLILSTTNRTILYPLRI